MASLQENIQRLKLYCDELRPRRSSDPLANDVYEEADDLRSFAETILRRDTRADYPARARQERECINRLKQACSASTPEELRRYEPIFKIAAEILAAAEAIPPSPDGHLGTLKSIRESFAFLQQEYSFALARERPIGICYASGTVFVVLEWAKRPSLSCSFGLESEPRKHFWVEDLLYMYGDQRYRTLPQELHLDSEEDVRNWFQFLAGIWRQYGHDVLADRPGIFDRLAKAQAQRDREYSNEMDRLYGTARPNGARQPE